MSLVLQVDILGEYKNLTAATKGAQNQLGQLNKRAQGISRSMNKAFAAIGIGLSLGVLKRELEEATKAANDDVKGQKLLAKSLENTVGATKKQLASTEDYISKMQLQTSVLDDKLRPAFAIAVRSTGSLTKGQELLNLALDVSAGTGKDLEIVTKSIARAYDGNYTGLQKLVPGIDKGAGAMDQLRTMFAGAAKEAADNDPYLRMQIILNDMQEQIGMALLPTLEQFSKWLTTPEGQEKMQEIVDFIVLILTKFTELVAYIAENKDWLIPVATALGVLVIAWQGVTTAIGIADVAQKLFSTNAVANAGIAMKAWGPLAALLGVLAVSDWASKTLQTSSPASKKAIGSAFSLNSTASPSAGGSNMAFNKPKTSSNITINTYNSNLTASDIVNKLNKAAKTNGGIGANW